VLLSHRIKRLEDSRSKSFFRGSFSNTPTRSSVKWLRGDKLFFESIFVVDLSCGLELVESDVGLILDHRPSSDEEF
jgi:hypothetical protein